MSRNPSLDVLRGIAVLLVIFCHYPIMGFMNAGRIGVDLFFVLSGFLISGLLFSEVQQRGSISVGRFLLRRGFKIYPPFYAFLLLTLLLNPSLGKFALTNAVFLQNFFPSATVWNHTWSLAVEEHFYLILPFALVILQRFQRLHWIPLVSCALIPICFVDRIITGILYRTPEAVVFRTDGRIDALFAGVALGYFYFYRRPDFERWSRWWMLPVGMALLIPVTLRTGVPSTVTQTSAIISCNLLAFMLIVFWAASRNVRSNALEFVGRYSYSIYLWHYPISFLFSRHPLTPLGFGLYAVTAALVGFVAALLIERPALVLRDKLYGVIPYKVTVPVNVPVRLPDEVPAANSIALTAEVEL